MVHLLSVSTAFHGRVIAARLGSDGILTELRGAFDGPYPGIGEVLVYVSEDELPVARELLLADEVESAFDEDAEPAASGVATAPAWLAMVAIVLVSALWVAEGFLRT